MTIGCPCHILQHSQIWSLLLNMGNGLKPVDFLESDGYLEVKVCTYSQINEYMTLYDYQSS